MQNITFLVLYNDNRQYAIYNHLLSSGYPVNLYDSNKSSNTIDSYIADSDVIILPTPVKEPMDSTIAKSICPKHMIFGGKLPFSFVKECEAKGAFVYDLLKNPTLANVNSIYTAEAAIGYIINTTPFSLYGSRCLMCGYGKCGRPISDLLRSLGATVDIYDMCQEAIIYAHSLGYNHFTSMNNIPFNNYDIIINSIPSNIFDDKYISSINDSCYIFDIASPPYGFNDNIFNRLPHIVRLPGIPGKYMPLSAGRLIADIVLSKVN